MRKLYVLILVLLFLSSTIQLSLADPTLEVGEEFKLTENSFDQPWRDSIDSQIFEVDFGDDSAVIRGGHQGEIKHTYASDGLYLVKVRPIDLDPTDGSGSNQPSGPWVEIGKVTVVIAHTPPEAKITADKMSAETGEDIDLDGSNSTGSYPIFNYAWDFGDGEKDNGRQTSHSYARPGEYTVTLTVTDELDATDSETTLLTVVSKEIPADIVTDDGEATEAVSDVQTTKAEEDTREAQQTDEAPINNGWILAGAVAVALGLGLGLYLRRRPHRESKRSS